MILKKYLLSFFRILFSAFILLLPAYSYSAVIDEMTEDALSKIGNTLNKIPDNIKRIAVYEIKADKSGKINIESLKDQLTTILMDSGKFKVVDREMLHELLKEQQLSQTGLIKTTEMVKVGQLIGMQGFFYGSIEVLSDKIILNLKVIDVANSSIVFSKKFIGEATASLTKIGIGWSYASTNYGTTFEITSGTMGNVAHSHEMDNLSTATLVNFSISYKQGFKALKWAQFGADIGFSKFFEPSNGEYKANIDVTDLGTEYIYHTTHTMSYSQITLKPRIYLSSKYLLGWAHDWINPYFGVTVNFVSFKATFSGWKERISGPGSTVDYEEMESTGDPYVILAPMLGFEINFTKSLSFFTEFDYFPSKAQASEKQGAYVAEMEMFSQPYINSGLTWAAGVKYYFSL